MTSFWDRLVGPLNLFLCVIYLSAIPHVEHIEDKAMFFLAAIFSAFVFFDWTRDEVRDA